MTGTADMISVLVNDHREVERIFRELEGGQGDPAHRRGLADTAIALLERHATAEEEYLYPTVRQAVPDGNMLADKGLREHELAEHVMRSLREVGPGDPRFDELLGQLMVDIRMHLAEEEADVFPRVRAACSERELADLGAKIQGS